MLRDTATIDTSPSAPNVLESVDRLQLLAQALFKPPGVSVVGYTDRSGSGFLSSRFECNCDDVSIHAVFGMMSVDLFPIGRAALGVMVHQNISNGSSLAFIADKVRLRSYERSHVMITLATELG